MEGEVDAFQEHNLIKEEREEFEEMSMSEANKTEGNLKRQNAPTLEKGKHQPTEEQLCELIMLLKKMFPHRELTRVITMIHQSLVQKLPYSQIFSELRIRTNELEVEGQQSSNNNNNQLAEVKLTFQKDSLQKIQFPSQHDQHKYKERRLMAKAFVAKGYSYQNAIDQFKKAKLLNVNYNQFTKSKYKMIMGSIASQAWRRLEVFLKESCKKDIVYLNREEIKKIVTPLLSPTHFGNQYISIFKIYIRYLYGLSNVTLIQSKSWEFYQLALKELGAPPSGQLNPNNENDNISRSSQNKDKNSSEISKQQTEEAKDKSMWTHQEDQELIKTFVSSGSVKTVTQFFKEKKFEHAKTDEISKRVIQLVMLALKRLENSAERAGINFPQLSGIDKNVVSRGQNALHFRIQLLKQSQRSQLESQAIIKLMKLLEPLLCDRDKEKIKYPPECDPFEQPVQDDFEVFDAVDDPQVKNQQTIQQMENLPEYKMQFQHYSK